MNLITTTQVIQIILGEAKTTSDCDITASFGDFNGNNFALGANALHSNGTTAVVAVAAPQIDTERQVKELRLFNNDTVAHTVTMRMYDGTTAWVVAPGLVSVPANGSFVYTPEAGITVNGTGGGGGGGGSLTVDDQFGNTIASTGTLTFEGVYVSGTSPSAITNMTTITGATGTAGGPGVNLKFTAGEGAPGSTYAYGGTSYLLGGYAGSGTTRSLGGPVRVEGGYGGPSTGDSLGGSFYGTGGNAGTASGTSTGGQVVLLGGTPSTAAYTQGGGITMRAANALNPNGAGGFADFIGGEGYGTGGGGAINLIAGNAFGSAAPGDVALSSGAALGSGPLGLIKFNVDPSIIATTYSWVAGAQLNNQTIFTTTRAMLITAVIGRVDAANGTPATLVIVKAASGTAPSGGTPLTSTSMDLTGTPNTNQTLTLSATLADITLAPGDSLCMVTTGTLAASAGCITVWGTPQ